MSFCVCSNCRRRRLTSSTRMPLPAAIRRLRDGLMIEGFARSSLVIERIIAAMRSISRSSMSTSLSCFSIPGILLRTDFSGPIRLTCLNWSKRSLRSILFSSIRREIEGQKQRIKELRNTLKSPALSGMPRGGDVSDPVARTVELIEKQEQILIESVEKCVRQQNRLLGFIQSVEDSRMRQILQYRHLDGLNWVQVACRMSVTPESVKMAYKRFFEGIQ